MSYNRSRYKRYCANLVVLLKKLTIALPLLLIRIYQVVISPHTPSSCRYTPTCSSYAIEAYKKHGVFKGSYLTLRRILRCSPLVVAVMILCHNNTVTNQGTIRVQPIFSNSATTTLLRHLYQMELELSTLA